MAWKLQVDGYSSRIAYLIRSEMLAKMNGVSVRADIFLALDYAHVRILLYECSSHLPRSEESCMDISCDVTLE